MPLAVPIDPAKLVEAAKEFADQGGRAGRPKSVWLRRAVSTAYYAVFHSLCREAAAHLLPNGTPEQQLRLTRSFGHGDLRGVCEWIRRGPASADLEPLVATLRSTPIRGVATAFLDLREAREQADYDHLLPVDKATAKANVNLAERAIETLRGANPRDREMFFSLLTLKAKRA